MSFFTNSLNQAVPGGNIAKPLMIALGALLLKKMLTPSAPEHAPQTPQLPPAASGGLFDGLNGLVENFQKNGYGSIIDSWIGKGANAPIQDKELDAAIGSNAISDLAKKANMSEAELLQQLSKALPTLVDKLTPNGRLPTAAEIESHY